MKDIVILGGGSSICEGISLNIWDKLQKSNVEVWSLNYAFLTLPFKPAKQLWIDTRFFKENIEKLQELYLKGVSCCAKEHTLYRNIKEIKTYVTTREPKEFNNKVFIGRKGLCGFFALYLASMIEKADNIFLLGYDHGTINNSNKTHYYQDILKTQSTGVGQTKLYKDANGKVEKEVDDYELFIRPEITSKIWNVSLQSNIKAFDKISYEQFFSKLENK
jgi:hypothetical protein